MICRRGCGMCCIVPSITAPLPGMPAGKPAGVACVNLDPEDYSCRLWGSPRYPELCRRFPAERDVCGDSRADAEQRLQLLELATAPGSS